MFLNYLSPPRRKFIKFFRKMSVPFEIVSSSEYSYDWIGRLIKNFMWHSTITVGSTYFIFDFNLRFMGTITGELRKWTPYAT